MTTNITQAHLFGQKNVAVAGTAEAIEHLGGNLDLISQLLIIAHDDNTGRVFYGSSVVDSSTQRGLAAGESVTFGAINDEPFDITEIVLDVSVSGEGADFVATRARRGSN